MSNFGEISNPTTLIRLHINIEVSKARKCALGQIWDRTVQDAEPEWKRMRSLYQAETTNAFLEAFPDFREKYAAQRLWEVRLMVATLESGLCEELEAMHPVPSLKDIEQRCNDWWKKVCGEAGKMLGNRDLMLLNEY